MVNRMLGSSNPAKFVLDLEMANEPGLVHVYSAGASQVLAALIREVTGERPAFYAQDHLFDLLSFSDTEWALSGGDTNIGGSQLYVTSRDMAIFGYLYLRNGTWGNNQIIPFDYIEETHQPLVSTNYGYGYGLHWWVDATHSYYCALGSQGQGIFIDPAYDLIMVVTGGSDSIPMEFYFESYVQRAAIEGYSVETTEETDTTDFDLRMAMLLTLVVSGGITIFVIIIYPKYREAF